VRLKAGFSFLLLAAVILFSISLAGPEEGLFKAAKVIDGDTIELEKGKRVRYTGIDTPETKHPSKPVGPLGEEAAAFNDSLVHGKIVRLETDIQVQDSRHWRCCPSNQLSIPRRSAAV
jgi:endonuclease YncB( thermonuclease family)